MPAYDFKCRDCSTVTEVVRPSSDDSPVTCPACGGETRRVFTAVGVHFKGSGFHSTDYRKSESSAEPAPSCGADTSSPSCAGCPAAENN